jgi:ferric-dicitrate binding protein FerR (iron transport regulator)
VKLVEEYAGVGALRFRERKIGDVAYRISRYQGMAVSGLPVPGLHRIEGTVALAGVADSAALVGANVQLDLQDGRTLALTVADEHGRVLAEGHGPRHGCSCC